VSHLFKEKKNILKSIKLLFLAIIFFIIVKTCLIYKGNQFIYLLFSIISLFLIFFSFRKKSIFYENFFGTFIFLGFWLKFSIIISFNIGFTEGLEGTSNITSQNYDDALIASFIGMLGIISFGLIREKFFFYPSKIELNINTEFYKKFRNIFITFLFFFIIFVCFINVYFQIYQRGLVGNSYNFLISGFIKTSLLYFLSLCVAIILFFDLASYKKVFILVLSLVIFEPFLSSVSMLSRGMIFNSLAIVFALYKLTNKTNSKLEINFYLKFLAFLFIVFYISVISVNHLRIAKYNIGNQPSASNTFKTLAEITKENIKTIPNISPVFTFDRNKTISEKIKINVSKSASGFYTLLIHRWVGINSMLLITKHKELLNFELFYKSLTEKYDSRSLSFYEENFKIYHVDNYKNNGSTKGNILPGLMAFLYYSGSYIFLFFSIILFSCFASLLEYLIYKSTNKNLIASGLIGMVIAYRFAHFGYLPSRSYLLFGSIIGLIILFFLIKFFANLIKIKLKR
jgi:hypothetical protein